MTKKIRTKRVTRNKFETKILEQLVKHKVSFKYEDEKIPYVLYRNYIPDFIIETPRGKIYIEAKGYLRPEHKAKMVAVKQQYPDLDIRMLFYSYNKKYIKWAEKYGFKYATYVIPEEWLNEF